jgi:hypothetical protein
VTDPAFTAAGAVSVPVRAGGISVHAGRMLHGSPHNMSDKQRRILFMQCPGPARAFKRRSVFLCKSVLYDTFEWARRALNS